MVMNKSLAKKWNVEAYFEATLNVKALIRPMIKNCDRF